MSSKKLAIVCTINNSKLHTLSFAGHFENIPGCRLILFLDEPRHTLYFEHRCFPDRITIVPCTKQHWLESLGALPKDMPEKQHTNLRRGAMLAKEMGYEWALSLDSDELVVNLEGLLEQIDTLGQGVDMLRLKPFELIHNEATAYSNRPFGGEYFRINLGWDLLMERREQLQSELKNRLMALKPLTRRLFFGHTNGKTIFRLSAPITQFKQHKQFSDKRKLVGKVLPTQFPILHFDAMNFKTWKFKWKRRLSGKTKATAISEQRKRQTDMIAESMRWHSWGAARRLFNEWYVFSDDEVDQMLSAQLIMKRQGSF